VLISKIPDYGDGVDGPCSPASKCAKVVVVETHP